MGGRCVQAGAAADAEAGVNTQDNELKLDDASKDNSNPEAVAGQPASAILTATEAIASTMVGQGAPGPASEDPPTGAQDDSYTVIDLHAVNSGRPFAKPDRHCAKLGNTLYQYTDKATHGEGQLIFGNI